MIMINARGRRRDFSLFSKLGSVGVFKKYARDEIRMVRRLAFAGSVREVEHAFKQAQTALGVQEHINHGIEWMVENWGLVDFWVDDSTVATLNGDFTNAFNLPLLRKEKVRGRLMEILEKGKRETPDWNGVFPNVKIVPGKEWNEYF